MITLSYIEDTGYIRIPYKDIEAYADEYKINQAEAFKQLLKKSYGPIFGNDYISDVYDIQIKKGLTGIKVIWRIRCDF